MMISDYENCDDYDSESTEIDDIEDLCEKYRNLKFVEVLMDEEDRKYICSLDNDTVEYLLFLLQDNNVLNVLLNMRYDYNRFKYEDKVNLHFDNDDILFLNQLDIKDEFLNFVSDLDVARLLVNLKFVEVIE